MSGFVYYIPNVNTVKADDLKHMGLDYAFDDQATCRVVANGPGGQNGVIVADERCVPAGKIGYYPDKQKWRKLTLPPFEPPLMVGMYTEDRPTPEVLARETTISGVWLRLEDGNQWEVPHARRWEEFDDSLLWMCNLPQRLSLDEDGQWMPGGVKPRFERLWSLAMAYESAFAKAMQDGNVSGGIVRFQFEPIHEFAVSALQANYRVGPCELDLLGVYDIEARDKIIDAVLDQATWNTWSKKKLTGLVPTGTPSSSGREASTPDTPTDTTPPSPTSEPMPQTSTAT